MKTYLYLFLLCAISISFSHCGGSSSSSNNPPVNPGNPPAGLAYSPNSLSVTQGTAGTSALPTLTGDTPFTFSVSASPASAAISIDAQGRITVSAQAVTGAYQLTVTVQNNAGSRSFANVYTVNVTAAPLLPSNLAYNPNTVNTTTRTTTSSAVPSISGTTPITFGSLSSTPAHNGALSLNTSTGVVTATNLAAGTYQVSLTATNAAGSTPFANVLTFTSVVPVTFDADILPLVTANCSAGSGGSNSCHGTGSGRNWADYNTARGRISSILDRVQRTPGSPGFMPQSGTPLTSTQIQLLQRWQADGLLQN